MNPAADSEKIAAFIENLPQIVPETWCLSCKICCRFPDTEGVQTPAWSQLEAGWAVQGHPERKDWLQTAADTPSLTPRLKPCGNGFHCPAFESGTNRCSIYPVRPLDCRLYPFVLTRDSSGEKVFLAMDLKCPYLEARGASREVSEYAAGLARYLDSPLAAGYLRANPLLVGPAFPEYVPAASVPAIAKAVCPPPERSPHPALKPLTLVQGGLVQEALCLRPHMNSRYTLAGLLGWMDLMRLWWAKLEGALCLFAEQGGGFFMPLPPLGAHRNSRAWEASWEILRVLNQGSAVSRIEALEFSSVKDLEPLGLKMERSELEYLYRREDLALLKGDRYRRQRWAANRCAREFSPRTRPFEAKDLLPCLALYTHWAIGRHQAADQPYPKALLRDGLFFHRRLLMDAAVLGLTGWVAESDGGLVGYTLGGWAAKDIFVVFLEITDRSISGLNAFLFRELCRGAEGGCFINAMGDSGLPNLARNKISYRPCGMVWSGAASSGARETETAMCSSNPPAIPIQ